MTRCLGASPSLYTGTGERKYLNRSERARVLSVIKRLAPDRALFCLTLAWSGARLSEVLSLTRAQFQVGESLITFRTLKRRRIHMREVPVPPSLMTALDRRYRLQDAQADIEAGRHDKVWPYHRVTAWRMIKSVMSMAGLSGAKACPKAFRHSFGTGTVQAGVPITLLQRWLGHARLTTTALYTEVSGPEELHLAAKYWRWSARHA
ncbi:MAG: tyrosine-type recombinase/integrase [Rhodomicrobium sp.]